MAQPIFASVNKPPLTTNENCCLSTALPLACPPDGSPLPFLVLALLSLLLVVLRNPASPSFLLPKNGCDSLQHTSTGLARQLLKPLPSADKTRNPCCSTANNTEDLLQTRFGSVKIWLSHRDLDMLFRAQQDTNVSCCARKSMSMFHAAFCIHFPDAIRRAAPLLAPSLRPI